MTCIYPQLLNHDFTHAFAFKFATFLLVHLWVVQFSACSLTWHPAPLGYVSSVLMHHAWTRQTSTPSLDSSCLNTFLSTLLLVYLQVVQFPTSSLTWCRLPQDIFHLFSYLNSPDLHSESWFYAVECLLVNSLTCPSSSSVVPHLLIDLTSCRFPWDRSLLFSCSNLLDPHSKS